MLWQIQWSLLPPVLHCSPEALDWRAHAANRGLSDKQQKLATKIRKLELRCATLQTESERIKVTERDWSSLGVDPCVNHLP